MTPTLRSARRLWMATLAALLVAACAPAAPSLEPDAKPKVRRVVAHELRTPEAFEGLSKVVGGERFSKFIVDVRTRRIYYFDVNVYRLHVDFVFNEIYRETQTNARLISFNRNYEGTKPEFLLCYLVHHLEQDEWTLAFWEGDMATPEHIRLAFDVVRPTFFAGERLKFRPDSTLQEAVAAELGPGIEVITNDKLYKQSTYQAFNPGESLGRLRIVGAGDDPAALTFATDEVVILARPLPDITPVRAIISEQFSTPLAHVALRARAWGIPHVGLKQASARYGALAGQVVRFEATPEGHTLRAATAGEIASDKAARKKAREVVIPPADLAETALKRLPELGHADAGTYGAKAANLGEIAAGELPGFLVPPGFAIPIHHYQAHLAAHGLDAKVDALLAEPRFRAEPTYRRAQLAALRAAVVAAPMAAALAGEIEARLGELVLPGGRGVFVRSSTNAEDLPGFNGAGLYDTVPNVVGAAAVGEAVKRVWASVWNLRAFEERSFFGIDHRSVYGGVLVQAGVNATAAGVLITANIFDPADSTAYTINAKSGLGMRVVEGRRVPEQLLFDLSNLGIKVISRSDEDTMLVFDGQGGVKEVPNPAKGAPVLTDDRAMALALAARSMTTLLPTGRPLDIEWLFEGNQLYIVQARPYLSP